MGLPHKGALDQPFALGFLTSEFARAAHSFCPFACLLDRRLLKMLLKLHFAKNAFALKFFLQSAHCLIDIIVADTDLHVVVTTFPG